MGGYGPPCLAFGFALEPFGLRCNFYSGPLPVLGGGHLAFAFRAWAAMAPLAWPLALLSAPSPARPV